MAFRETPDELRMKIANYQRTRQSSARSMHRWLDRLIADTQEQLRELTPAEASRPAVPAPRPMIRYAYPLEREPAGHQRSL